MVLDSHGRNSNPANSLTSIVSSQRQEYIPTLSTNLRTQDYQETLRRYGDVMSTYPTAQINDGLAAASFMAMESPSSDFAIRSSVPQPEIETEVDTETKTNNETAIETKIESSKTPKNKKLVPSAETKTKPNPLPYQCPVCLNSVQGREPATTTCGHVFCSNCIKTALSATCKCPVCQKLMTIRQLIRIYI